MYMPSLSNGRQAAWQDFLSNHEKGKEIAQCIHQKRFWIPPGGPENKNAQPAVYISKKIASIVLMNHDYAHEGLLKKEFAVSADVMSPHVFEGLICIASAANLTIVPFFPEDF